MTTMLEQVQQAAYPVYQVQITYNTSVNGGTPFPTVMSFFVAVPQLTGPNTAGDMSPEVFAALKSWAENFNWAQYNGEVGTYQQSAEAFSYGGFSVTEGTGVTVTEQTENVTPAG